MDQNLELKLKLLEENIGGNLHDPELGKAFLGTAPKAQVTNKQDFIETKNFYVLKDTMKKEKRQPTECKKIFANRLTSDLKLEYIKTCKNLKIKVKQSN